MQIPFLGKVRRGLGKVRKGHGKVRKGLGKVNKGLGKVRKGVCRGPSKVRVSRRLGQEVFDRALARVFGKGNSDIEDSLWREFPMPDSPFNSLGIMQRGARFAFAMPFSFLLFFRSLHKKKVKKKGKKKR